MWGHAVKPETLVIITALAAMTAIGLALATIAEGWPL